MTTEKYKPVGAEQEPVLTEREAGTLPAEVDSEVDRRANGVAKDVGDVVPAVQETPEALPLDGVKVLGVDDEPVVTRAYKRFFKKRGAVCFAATTGVEGYNLVDELVAGDVVILDGNLGNGVSGYELARKIHARKQDLLIYILSGTLDTTKVQELIQEGIIVRGYQKPSNFDALIEDIVSRKAQ